MDASKRIDWNNADNGYHPVSTIKNNFAQKYIRPKNFLTKNSLPNKKFSTDFFVRKAFE